MRKTDCMWPRKAWWLWCRCDLQWDAVWALWYGRGYVHDLKGSIPPLFWRDWALSQWWVLRRNASSGLAWAGVGAKGHGSLPSPIILWFCGVSTSLKPRARCLNSSARYPKCVDEISAPSSHPVGFVACIELYAHHGWWLPEAFRATDLKPVLFISAFLINFLVGSVLSLSFRESPPHICPYCRVQWHLC